MYECKEEEEGKKKKRKRNFRFQPSTNFSFHNSSKIWLIWFHKIRLHEKGYMTINNKEGKGKKK